MGKNRSAKPSLRGMLKPTPSTSPNPPQTTSDLNADLALQYKIKVLLYDLARISKDPASEQRTSSSTDELYISALYFPPEEGSCVASALVVGVQDTLHDTTELSEQPQMTVKDAIHTQLTNFFEKRRASGDARPCGPHDMAPVYMEVFGIGKEELEDEKFFSRLRRQGLPPVTIGHRDQENVEANVEPKETKERGRRKKKK